MLLDTVNMYPTKEALTVLSVYYVGQDRQLARQLTVMEEHSGEARAYRGAYRVRVAIKRAYRKVRVLRLAILFPLVRL